MGVYLRDYLVHLLSPQPPELGTGLRHEIGDHPCDVISEAPVRLPSVQHVFVIKSLLFWFQTSMSLKGTLVKRWASAYL